MNIFIEIDAGSHNHIMHQLINMVQNKKLVHNSNLMQYLKTPTNSKGTPKGPSLTTEN